MNVPARGPRAQLVLTASLTLFVELALIRWLGANVVYLAYFSNIVLLGSFLGIGAGFLWASRRDRSLFVIAPATLAALVVLTGLLDVRVGIAGGDLIFFGLDTSGSAPVGRAAGCLRRCGRDGLPRRCGPFVCSPPQPRRLPARSRRWPARRHRLRRAVVLYAEPVVWGTITAAGLLVAIFVPRRVRQSPSSSFPGSARSGARRGISRTGHDLDAYYKVHTTDRRLRRGRRRRQRVPTWLQFRAVGNPLYETVYERFTAQSPVVLIIGAGSGNDVAVALARGATSVDAEIDEHLLDVGRTHPDRPYVTILESTLTSPTDRHS